MTAASITRLANPCQDISWDLLKCNEHECKDGVHDGEREKLKKADGLYLPPAL